MGIFGDKLISGLLNILGLGLKKIVFVGVPAWRFAVIPAILLAALGVVTVGICAQIRRMDTAIHINE